MSAKFERKYCLNCSAQEWKGNVCVKCGWRDPTAEVIEDQECERCGSTQWYDRGRVCAECGYNLQNVLLAELSEVEYSESPTATDDLGDTIGAELLKAADLLVKVSWANSQMMEQMVEFGGELRGCCSLLHRSLQQLDAKLQQLEDEPPANASAGTPIRGCQLADLLRDEKAFRPSQAAAEELNASYWEELTRERLLTVAGIGEKRAAEIIELRDRAVSIWRDQCEN